MCCNTETYKGLVRLESRGLKESGSKLRAEPDRKWERRRPRGRSAPAMSVGTLGSQSGYSMWLMARERNSTGGKKINPKRTVQTHRRMPQSLLSVLHYRL